MLIGGDLMLYAVRSGAKILHNQSLPSALDTVYGWIIFGSLNNLSSFSGHLIPVISSSFNEMMQAFLSVEESTQHEYSVSEDQQCEN